MESPKSIFKYINLNHSSDIIKKIIYSIFNMSRLKITTPRHFNDRFDSRILLNKSSISDLLRMVDALVPGSHTLNEDRIKSLALQLESQPILCLTRNDPVTFDADIMWGLYGGNGNGICLEFDFNRVLDIHAKVLNTSTKFNVEYDDRFTKYEIFKSIILSKMRAEVLLSNGVQYDIANNDYSNALHKFHYTKGMQWSHEVEYRLTDSFNDIDALLNKNYSIKDKLAVLEDLARKDDYFIPLTNNPRIFELPLVKGAQKTIFQELHLPIPKAVYIGAQVFDSRNQFWRSQLNVIRGYAGNNNISLFQLTGQVDYTHKVFEYCGIN